MVQPSKPRTAIHPPPSERNLLDFFISNDARLVYAPHILIVRL